MPKLSHEVEVVNPKTKKKGTVILEGLASFSPSTLPYEPGEFTLSKFFL